MGSSADSRCQFSGCYATEVDGCFCKAHSRPSGRRLAELEAKHGAVRCHMCGYDAPISVGGLVFLTRSQVWVCTDGNECQRRRTPVVGRVQGTAPVPKGPAEFKGKIDGGGVKGSMRKMKLPLNLIPPLFIQMIALVLAFGAKKYAKNNWLRGMSVETVLESVKRHVQEFEEGHEYDKESRLPVLAHAACGIMFLIWFMYGPNRRKYRKLDDRQWVIRDNGEKDPEYDVDAELERINTLPIPKVS